jgi:hypothetical protein
VYLKFATRFGALVVSSVGGYLWRSVCIHVLNYTVNKYVYGISDMQKYGYVRYIECKLSIVILH